MPPSPSTPPAGKGPIAWMAHNHVAANLLMGVIIVAGALALVAVKQEIFPSFTLDQVSIAVPYPGASPEEVEQGIVLAVEEEVRGLDGVKRVSATASEGMGRVRAELLLDANPDRVLSDVKAAVDRITSFPEEAEEPSVSLASRRREVVSLILAGEQELATLHALAERGRRALLDNPNITQVEIQGVPPVEISIEIPRATLEAYGLTLDDVARQVAASSVELPGGELETTGGEILVRVADRRKLGHEFADIVLRGTQSGYQVRLGDIATIRDGYKDTDQATYFNGKPAVRITAFRVGSETPTEVSAAVHALKAELERTLPDNITLAIWDDDSEILEDRINLLVKNAVLGLLLVVFILALFLRPSLAIWVSLGIPISFLGAFALMPGMDISINMITLFAFIITLGMVVDDAIVVGENIFSYMEAGTPKMQAAIQGAREMAVPVTFAILTSIVAFSPMFFVPGVMGKIFRFIPSVVIAVLGFSLVEAFAILPAHLGHGRKQGSGGNQAHTGRVQKRVQAGLNWFIRRLYAPSVRWALHHRALTLASAIAMLLLVFGLVASGRVPFSFFPKLEGDVVRASAELPYGVPLERTLEVREELLAAAHQAVDTHGGDSILRGILTQVGQGAIRGGPSGGLPGRGSHVMNMEVNLIHTGQRAFTAAEFAASWRDAMPDVAGVKSLVIDSAMGPSAGKPVNVQLTHPDTETLAGASASVTEALRGYSDLTNIANSYAAGKPQLDFHLLPRAQTLGVTSQAVGRQLRSAFFGAEALREQRGRNEMRVMVRLPEHQRRSEYDLQHLRVRTPGGGHVPLHHLVGFERQRAPTEIVREDGKRIVNVTAELASGVVSPREVLAALRQDVIPELEQRYAGLSVSLVGEQREQQEAFASLGRGFALAMFVIFALLAVVFRSYAQPAIIMAAIPFGFVGAVAGHVLMGYELSLMSLFGIIALSGVVVNDSLVLIDAANRARARGATAVEAISWAGERRLRPILLTSLTTFFGLMPMILETSVQAQFLIPMAISLGFGILFATAVILVLVPVLFMLVHDADQSLRRAVRGLRGAEQPPRDKPQQAVSP